MYLIIVLLLTFLRRTLQRSVHYWTMRTSEWHNSCCPM